MHENIASRAWVVLNTHPHKERFALENLARQSFVSYCPMVRTRISHARTTRHALRPLFPGYVFAAVDTDMRKWKPLLSTFGVRSVIRNGERLSFLPNGFVEALRAREIEGAVSGPAAPLRIGQAVKVSSGAFDGLIATIIEIGPNQRIVVLMDLLNRPTPITMRMRDVSDALV